MMKSVVMDETVEAVAAPSPLAKIVAHVLIALLVTTVTKAVFRQKLTIAIVAGLLALAAHHHLDAPIARKLSELGL